MKGGRLTVRATALLGAGSAAIHQLRYTIGYGDSASHALAAHPHHYMAVALPAVMAVALVALALLLMRLACGEHESEGRRAPLWLLWVGCSFALAAIFGIQETLEGAGAFAGGGWIGLALAAPAGLLVALGLRGSEAAELRATALLVHIRLVGETPVSTRASVLCARLNDLRLGARGPPLPSVV